MSQHLSKSISVLRASILMFALVFTVSAASELTAANITGTIKETMDAAGYTYMNLATGDQNLWVAIPQSKVKVGDKVSVVEGMEMKNFHSNSFDRTFDAIIFSPGMVGAASLSPHGTSAPQPTPVPQKGSADDSFSSAVAAERAATGGGAAPVQPSQGSAGSMGAVVPFTETEVERADGENSYTVGEIFEQAQDLDGKKVRVRGQVVKFNANIMGRNWLHLQDGTGDPMQNTHDLVVTTADQLSSPNVITIEGVVAADRDFGAGYKYVVIVEDSVILSQ